MPGTKPIKKWLESGFLIKADTIEDLARQAGIDPAGLTAQVARYNRFVETGINEEFHKREPACAAIRRTRPTPASARSPGDRSMPPASSPAMSAPSAAS